MLQVSEHLGLLGKKVEDRVTKFAGVVASVSFDLYGCIQALVNPGKDKDGKLLDQMWFDVSRLKVVGKPVMLPPNFDFGPKARGEQGAAEKPRCAKP